MNLKKNGEYKKEANIKGNIKEKNIIWKQMNKEIPIPIIKAKVIILYLSLKVRVFLTINSIVTKTKITPTLKIKNPNIKR